MDIEIICNGNTSIWFCCSCISNRYFSISPYHQILLTVSFYIGFILGIVASYFVYREIVDDKKVLPGSANNSEKRRLYAEEDNFEEIRRLNTIDLIRSKQATTFTASTDFVPMNVSTGTKLTSEGSNGRGGGGGDWMGKWTNGGKSQNGHYQDIR